MTFKGLKLRKSEQLEEKFAQKTEKDDGSC